MLSFLNKAVSIAIILALFPIHVYANALPSDFQYHGKPISAICIAELANGNSEGPTKVNLSECTREENKYKLVPYKPMIEKGFVGFDYTAKKSSDSYEATESAYYKYLGMFKNSHVIYLVYSGGGSGSFTSVFLVDRKDDSIEYVKNIVATGDRCNGGISEVSLKDNKLLYSLNITPYDYIDLSEIKMPDVKAYDDLAACAACCQGTANYESDFERSKFVSLDIGDAPEQNQGTYQECFNKMLKDYKQQGKQTMSPIELKAFVEQFKTQCVKK